MVDDIRTLAKKERNELKRILEEEEEDPVSRYGEEVKRKLSEEEAAYRAEKEAADAQRQASNETIRQEKQQEETEKLEKKTYNSENKLSGIKSKIIEKTKNSAMGRAVGSGIGYAKGIGSISLFGVKVTAILAIAFGIIFLLLVLGKATWGEDCSEYHVPGTQGYDEIWADYNNVEFTNCVLTNAFSDVGVALEKIDFTRYIMEFINQQVYKATGDYWYTAVDENQVPMGVFIEKIDTKDKYYTHEVISIPVTLKVETVDQEVKGVASGSINGIPCSSTTPENGTFSVTESQKRTIICKFDRDIFSKTENTKFNFQSRYDFMTFAYMTPLFIKSSAWDNRSDQQKAEIENLASQNFLKTHNAPVWIAGEIDGEQGKRRVDVSDPSVTEVKDIIMGITLHADKQDNGWDKGEVNEIKEFIMVFPSSLSLQSDSDDEQDSDSVEACGGYTFTLSHSCPELEKQALSYLSTGTQESQGFICNSGDNVYSLDRSGSNKKFKSFSTFESISCVLKADINGLFTSDDVLSDGSSLGVNQVPIKIFTSYEYDVSKTARINIAKSQGAVYDKIKQYTCIGDIEKNASQGTESQNKDTYAQKYQNTVRKNIPQLADMEEIRYEAVVAAIIEAYNGFEVNPTTDVDDDGTIDYITGCRKSSPLTDETEEDIKCLISRFQSEFFLKNSNDVEKSMKAYYEANKNTYSTEQQATLQDYYNWLRTLCKNVETAVDTTATPTVTAVNVLKENEDSCTKDSECKSGLCVENSVCKPCHDTENPCPANMRCTNEVCENV
ncbi:hypothetical protein H6503_01610 [Candidatus Woesearchaeota archaeon]|nr:hypothetical protein [Candidatus Woesearchaeota archaeon]